MRNWVQEPKHFDQDALSKWLKTGGFIGLPEDRFLLGWGNWLLSTEAPDWALGFYAPDFHLRQTKPWWIPQYTANISKLELLELLNAAVVAKPQFSTHWDEPSFEAFQAKFESLQAQLQSGELQKAVPVVFAKAKVTVDSQTLTSWISAAVQNHGERIAYGLWSSDFGVLGVTPEWLFQMSVDGRSLQTMALAGTRRSDESKSLLQDEKELHEHAIVVRDISQRLYEYGEARLSPTEEWAIGPLTHLRTKIQVHFNEPKSFEWVVERLHPTPALGVLPRVAALEQLEFLQVDEQRLRFGAPFGVKTAEGIGFCVVAIRNLQWLEGTLLLGSGCGIVPQSRLQREWDELRAKRDSVKAIFGLRG